VTRARASLVAALAVLAALAACGGDAPDELVVRTEGGDVRGELDAPGVRAFRGIPYAAPPVGANRWRPPQPAAPWDGVRDAGNVGAVCPQGFGFGPGGGDEDCLYLNVWTPSPAPADDAPAPVMVWIHGGAFQFGSGGEDYYAGTVLTAAHGVVVVTANYRLGPLGFLAHPALAVEDPAHPTSGNYGIEDQIAALAWVQRNIAAFGGDPGRVLLFGESAGGFSTCVHYLSPRAGTLFHAAISESGLCASDAVERTLADAEADGAELAAALGCTGGDELACLRAISPWEVLDAGGTPMADTVPGGPFYQDGTALGFAPVVDGTVIPATTRAALAAGGFANVPLVLGTNRDEGTLFHAPLFATPVTTEPEYRDALGRRFGAGNVDAIVAEYPIASFADANAAIAEVTGDAVFVCPARRTARAVAAAGATVHLYAFQKELENPGLPRGGVVHAAEIPFVFGVDTFPLGDVGTSGRPVSEAIQGYWTRFARTGDPNGDGAVGWPRYDAATDEHLVLDQPIAAGSGHKAARCDFWDALVVP
jgi:para-nitrobenzyl esterase